MFRTTFERALGLLAVLATAGGAGLWLAGQVPPAAAQEKKTDKDLLQGTWTVVGCKERGQEIPKEDLKAEPRMTFKGDRIAFATNRGEPMAATFALDVTREPRRIQLTMDGEPDKK